MEKLKSISFIIPNFNTKKYTEFVYNSIRNNLGHMHEIVMLDDDLVMVHGNYYKN